MDGLYISLKMKILLVDRVHELFKQQFLKWNWTVVEGYDWDYSKLVQEINSFEVCIF